MNKNVRESEQAVLADRKSAHQLSRLRQQVDKAQENLEIEAFSRLVRRARKRGDIRGVKTAKKKVEKRRRMLDEIRDELESQLTGRTKKLRDELRRADQPRLIYVIAFAADEIIGSVEGFNSQDSKLQAIYDAALDGNRKKIRRMLSRVSIVELAADISVTTGSRSSLLWVQGFLDAIAENSKAS